jgi:hypothetical protein
MSFSNQPCGADDYLLSVYFGVGTYDVHLVGIGHFEMLGIAQIPADVYQIRNRRDV